MVSGNGPDLRKEAVALVQEMQLAAEECPCNESLPTAS